MSAYRVTREGQELGSFGISEIQEGLKTGLLQATDWAWCEGMEGWKGLSEIVDLGTSATPPPQARAISSPLSAPVKRPAGRSQKPVEDPNPYAPPIANVKSAAAGSVPYPVIAELTGTKPWVRLISVLMWIVCAVFIGIVLLIVGAQSLIAGAMSRSGSNIGWSVVVGTAFFYGITAMLIVYPTMKLSNYASHISRLATTQSYTHLTVALAEQRRFWKFYGILIVIYLCLAALFVLLALLIGGGGTSVIQPH